MQIIKKTPRKNNVWNKLLKITWNNTADQNTQDKNAMENLMAEE